MNREILPTKFDKILGIWSNMYQEAIPKKETSNSSYIERSGDGDFEWNTLKISRANRRGDDGDRIFQGVGNPKNSTTMKSHGWNMKSAQEFESGEEEASVVFEWES
jgi:hypothetical protein